MSGNKYFAIFFDHDKSFNSCCTMSSINPSIDVFGDHLSIFLALVLKDIIFFQYLFSLYLITLLVIFFISIEKKNLNLSKNTNC